MDQKPARVWWASRCQRPSRSAISRTGNFHNCLQTSKPFGHSMRENVAALENRVTVPFWERPGHDWNALERRRLSAIQVLCECPSAQWSERFCSLLPPSLCSIVSLSVYCTVYCVLLIPLRVTTQWWKKYFKRFRQLPLGVTKVVYWLSID